MYRNIQWGSLFFLILWAAQAQAQCISGDCTNGRGIYVYPSGAKYAGDFKDGQIHGEGVCYYTDGSSYRGQWRNRYPSGRGIKTLADGTQMEGTWERGILVADNDGNPIQAEEERVLASSTEADVQAGCVSGDCDNGRGTFLYSDGSRYEGDFKNRRRHGQGTFTAANGDRYEGQWEDNFEHGNGALAKADGKSQKGFWVEGEYIGQETPDKYLRDCSRGDCMDGRGIFRYGGGVKYVGDFKDGWPNGWGVLVYPSGDRYEGEWRTLKAPEGIMHGYGTYTQADGVAVSGYWDEGAFIGSNPPAGQVPQASMAAKPEEPLAQQNMPAPARKLLSEQKMYAVVVGVASYSHMPALRYTDDDAYRFYSFLKSADGLALPDSQIRILVDDAATHTEIVATMNEMFSKADEDDLVLLYFSGHGLKGAFLPIDFDGSENKLAHDEVTKIFAGSRAKHKICIADACHSGSIEFGARSSTSALEEYYLQLAETQGGTALMMSSKGEETSLESKGLRQGVFSHFLIKGLGGEADTNNDRIVSVTELHNFVAKEVAQYTQRRQSPVLKGQFDPNMPVSVVVQEH